MKPKDLLADEVMLLMWVDQDRLLVTHIQVGVAVGSFQYAFAKFVVEDFGIPVMSYSHGETFFGIKFHLPVSLPFFQSIQIFLKGNVIMIIHNLTIDDTIVGKKSDIGTDVGGQIINISQK